MPDFKNYLIENKACEEAKDWALDMPLSEVWEKCDRGDWMLWLIKKAHFCDLKLLTLIKVECVELVAHLMRDERSKNALKVARKFADGEASRDELDAAAADAAYAAAAAYAYAYAAATAAADAAAAAAATADAAAADTAAAAADAAYAAAAAAYAAAADAAAAAAEKEILSKCADICRKHIPNPVIEYTHA